MNPEIPVLTLRELILWILRRRKHFRIKGNSMYPLFKPGDLVLVDSNAYQIQEPKPGEVVIAWHPLQPDLKMVKRVRVVYADGRVGLAGDNPAESTDFDSIMLKKLLGRVTSKFP
jgi:nickel-type superoxide dismutase maturation protease